MIDYTRMPESKYHVRQVSDAAAIFRVAAQEFVRCAGQAIAARGSFSVALSGGSTPKGLYGLLTIDEFRGQVAWDKVFLFWGDERSVPPDDGDSNYRMANEAMLSKLPLAASQIFRIRGEIDAAQAAAEYEQALQKHFQLAAGAFPSIDLVLLGMGPDGHTASLFPGTKALQEQRRLVVSNWVGKFYTQRITMTAPVLTNAQNILFLVNGADKAQPLKAVLEGPFEPAQLPSQLILSAAAKTLWLVDPSAAKLLSIPKEENA
jgi:6-phosphogluconolactonase